MGLTPTLRVPWLATETVRVPAAPAGAAVVCGTPVGRFHAKSRVGTLLVGGGMSSPDMNLYRREQNMLHKLNHQNQINDENHKSFNFGKILKSVKPNYPCIMSKHFCSKCLYPESDIFRDFTNR